MEDEIRLGKGREHFDALGMDDLFGEVWNEIERLLDSYTLEPGSRVGITAGSRGVSDAVEVYRAAVETLKEKGHEPFLFASMGSHGRGMAKGQQDLLHSLGVTEENV